MATGGNLHSKGSNSSGKQKSSKSCRSPNVEKEFVRSQNGGLPNNWWRSSLLYSDKKSRNRDNINDKLLANESSDGREQKGKTSSTYSKTGYLSPKCKSQWQAREHFQQIIPSTEKEEFHLELESKNEGTASIVPSSKSYCNSQDRSSRDGLNIHKRSSHHSSKSSQKNTANLMDSSQIVCHLSHLRNYQQQVISHREVLQNSHNVGKNKEQISRLTRLFNKLKKQEKQYLDLLQNLLIFHEDRLTAALENSDSENSAAESTSITGDFQSEASEVTTDGELNIRDRPRIEDKIDFVSQEDNTANNSEHGNIRRSHSLNVSRRSHSDLFTEIQSFQGRQATLEALQRRAEKKLSQVRQLQGDTHHDGIVISQASEVDGFQNVDQMSLNLEDLNHRLNIIHHLYDNRQRAESMSRSVDDQVVEDCDGSALIIAERQDLQNKLRDMQDKKQHMNELLYELKTLKSQRTRQMNNEIETFSTASSQIMTNVNQKNSTLQETQELLQTLDTREKFRDQELINENSEVDEEFSLPAFSDYEDPQLIRNLRQIHESKEKKEKISSKKNDNRIQQRTENTSRDDLIDQNSMQRIDHSQNNSTENQTMQRKTQIVNEKLRQLKELVDSVKGLPLTSQSLPEDLSELANAAEGDQTLTGEFCGDQDSTFWEALSEGEISTRKARHKILRSHSHKDHLVPETSETTLHSLQKNLKKLQLYDHLQHNEHDNSFSAKSIQRNNIRLKEMESFRENHNENLLLSQLNNPRIQDESRIKKSSGGPFQSKGHSFNSTHHSDCQGLSFQKNNPSDSLSLQPLLNELPSTSLKPVVDGSTAATWDDSTQDNLEVDDDSQENEDEDDREYSSDSIAQAEEEEEEAYGLREENDFPEQIRSELHKHNMPNNQPYHSNKCTVDYEDFRREHDSSGNDRNFHLRRCLHTNTKLRQENNCSTNEMMINRELGDNEDENSNCLQHLKQFQMQLDKTSSICQILLKEHQVMVDQMQANFRNQSLLNYFRRSVNSSDLLQQYSTYLQQQQVFHNLHQFCLQLHQQQLEMQIIQQQLNLIKNSSCGNSESVLSNSTGSNFCSLNPFSHLNNFSPFMTIPFLTPSFMWNHSFPAPSHLSSNIASLNNTSQVQNNISLSGSGEGSNICNRNNTSINNLSGNSDSLFTTRGIKGTSAHQLFLDPKPSCSPSLETFARNDNIVGDGNVDSCQHIKNTSLKTIKPLPTFDSLGKLKPLHKKRKREPGSSTHSDASISSKHNQIIMPNQRQKIENTNLKIKQDRNPSFKNGLPPDYKANSRSEDYAKRSPSRKSQTSGFTFDSFSHDETIECIHSPEKYNHNGSHNNLIVQVERDQQNRCPTPIFIDTDCSNSFMNSQKDLSKDTVLKPKWDKSSDKTKEPSLDCLSSSADPMLQNIYSEVASLISQNESQLQFLLEMFQTLQLVNSDYLRQKCLYIIKDLISKCNSESNFEKNQYVKNNSPQSLSLQAEESYSFNCPDNLDSSSSQSSVLSHHEPFADDSLGNTVIHVDQFSHIDTQQLNRQIKLIILDLIPLLKERMNDICSQPLLSYIRRLIFALTRRREKREDFVQFFNKQLGSMLRDTLSKYTGRKLQDCSEKLVQDISEVLFNELAFFGLMHGLDSPNKTDEFINTEKHNDNTESWDFFEEKNEGATNIQPSKIKLVKSETKAMTMLGSDEDVDSVDSTLILTEQIETAVEELNDRDSVKDGYCYHSEENDQASSLPSDEESISNSALKNENVQTTAARNLTDIIQGLFLNEASGSSHDERLINGIAMKSRQTQSNVSDSEDFSLSEISLTKKQLDRKVTEESHQNDMNGLTEELLSMISHEEEVARNVINLPNPSSL